MTFGPDHYVPVLKIKRGEKAALRSIAPAACQHVTPLLEIVERTEERCATVAEHLTTTFKDFAVSVQSYARCFIDAREIAPDGPAAAAAAFQRAAAEGIAFTPVTGISRTFDVAPALAHRTHGLALRLTRAEFEGGRMGALLGTFMAGHGLAPEEVDLIVDLGPVDDFVEEGVSALGEAFLAAVPDIRRWRTLSLAGCAFPMSMGGVDRHSHDIVDRAEWMAWRGLQVQRATLDRLPTFGDCAIQHPRGVEGFDPRTMQVSASVRYTLPDAWLLIKGESTRTTPPSRQFPALATQLVYGHLRGHFAGAGHCDGCARMKAAADGARGLGSAEAWRRLGTIHHITRAVDGMLSLPWP